MSDRLWNAGALVARETFLLVSWCGLCIATICVIGRITTRISVFKRLAVDDYFVLLAWGSSIAFSVVWHVKSRHLYAAIDMMVNRMPIDYTIYLALLFDFTTAQTAAIICQLFGLWLIKVSFLLFFRKMGDQIQHQRILWWVVTVSVAIGFIISVAVVPWQCHTGLREPGGVARVMRNCSTPKLAEFTLNTLRVQAAMDITTDAAILTIPFTILWQVRLSIRRKLALAGIFALILFIVLCVILRVVIVQTTAVDVYMDVTWLFLWHKIELDTAIIVACLASFRALYTSQRNRKLSTYPLQAVAKNKNPGSRQPPSWGSSVQSGSTVVSPFSPSKVHVKKDFQIRVSDSDSPRLVDA